MRFPSFKKYLHVGTIGLVSLVMIFGFGCKAPSEVEQAAIRPTVINYWTVFNNVEQLQKFAAEYKKLRPYVTVNIRQVRYEEFDKLFVNALADDVAPDVISVHNRWLRKYKDRLSPMPSSVKVANIRVEGKYAPKTIITLEQNKLPTLNDIRSQYVQAVSDDVVIGSDAYGLPLAMDTLALYYNKDLLDRSGVALPPETWNDFVAAVKQTTKFDAEGKIIQSGVAMGTGKNVENAFDILSLFMMQNDARMADGLRVAFADGFDRGEVVNHPVLQALRFYSDFGRPTKEVYSWNGELGSSFDAFVRGRAVFYLGFGYDFPRIRTQAPQLNVEVIPVPQLNQQAPINVANYWVEAVVKKSPNQDVAWDFVRFISHPTNIKVYADSTHQPSPLRVHIREQSQDPTLAPFATQALFATNWYKGRDIDTARQAFAQFIDDHLLPYSENQTPFRRDANLVIRAAQIVQQTM